MELQLIQVILQGVSSFAIFGGLVYTAVQFRKSREAQHYANFAKLVEMQAHLREMRVKDPALASVYVHDAETARTDAEVRQYFFNLMQLGVFEIVWFGHKRGQVPKDYFLSWERRMREIAAERSFRAMMGSGSMKIMHDEFQAYVEEMVRATPAR